MWLAYGAAVAALSGCDRGPAADSMFPLEGGHRWTYRVETRPEESAAEIETLTLRTVGVEKMTMLDDQAAWRRRSESGVDYWLRADATGIYRIASKSDFDAEPILDKPQRFVLKAPFTVGTQWQASTTSYLLMRRNEFPREIRHSHPSVPMTYQIEATDEGVETRAGHFAHCLRVLGVASVRIFVDPVGGWRDMPLTTLEWYCPGVGLVRVERNEPGRSTFLTGGSRTLELESWH
jgi:hypothetical protein